MALWDLVSGITSVGIAVGEEWNQHHRENYLHREAIAQSLRCHEASSNAAKMYHRTAIKQDNDQHSRSILQSMVQHEEDISLQKRIAVRENLGDEWAQLNQKAQTVLVVSTLVLGITFSLLVEGDLPESISQTNPILLVFYNCLLGGAVCFILLSIRLAMVFRVRIGKIIVREMREAILEASKVDSNFRNQKFYAQCNRAKRRIPVPDDHRYRHSVQPITRTLSNPELGRRHVPAFQRHEPGNGLQEGTLFKQLHWLNHHVGYPFQDFMRSKIRGTLSCGRRNGKVVSFSHGAANAASNAAPGTTMSAPAVLETSISEPASPPIPLNRYSSSGSLMGIIGGVSGILSNVISDKSLEDCTKLS